MNKDSQQERVTGKRKRLETTASPLQQFLNAGAPVVNLVVNSGESGNSAGKTALYWIARVRRPYVSQLGLSPSRVKFPARMTDGKATAEKSND